MWQSIKTCLLMGDQCHWLPVREQKGTTRLHIKQNKDAGSWEGSAGLPSFQGIIGGTLKTIVWCKTTSPQVQGPSPLLRKHLFSQSGLSFLQGWREPGLLLVEMHRAHGGSMMYGLTRRLHWRWCFSCSQA